LARKLPRLTNVIAGSILVGALGVGAYFGVKRFLEMRNRAVDYRPETSAVLEEATTQAEDTEAQLSEGQENLNAAVLNLMSRNWNETYKSLKSLGINLINARISNYETLKKLSEAKVSNAYDAIWTDEVRLQPKQFVMTELSNDSFYTLAWPRAKLAYQNYINVSAREASMQSSYNVTIAALKMKLSDWSAMRGDLYAKYRDKFVDLYNDGLTLQEINDSLSKQILAESI